MADKSSDSTNYSPIQCEIYDYIEIACMRHYHLIIELSSGDSITGKAITTKVKDKKEFILIETDSGSDKTIEIRLDLVKSIQPLDKNAEFGRLLMS